MYVQFECFDQSAGYDQQQVDRFRFDSILFLFHLNVVVSGLCVCVCAYIMDTMVLMTGKKL